jgi:TorA maturation chaperone TorD
VAADQSEASAGAGPAPEERARADAYGLLAALLARAPDPTLLAALRGLQPASDAGPAPLDAAWAAVREAAAAGNPTQIEREYYPLFIGLGRGELVPYGSWYLTGFLMERPLADLREDLGRLGFERQAGVSEPEDHAAALCEVMRMIILDAGLSCDNQRAFFEAHVAPWMGRFFGDLERAETAGFYRAVGGLGVRFMELERAYFDMPA